MWIAFYWQSKIETIVCISIELSSKSSDNDAFDHHCENTIKRIYIFIGCAAVSLQCAAQQLSASSVRDYCTKIKISKDFHFENRFRWRETDKILESLHRVLSMKCVRNFREEEEKNTMGKYRGDVFISGTAVAAAAATAVHCDCECHTRKHLILFTCDRQLFIQISFDSNFLATAWIGRCTVRHSTTHIREPYF